MTDKNQKRVKRSRELPDVDVQENKSIGSRIQPEIDERYETSVSNRSKRK